MKKSGKMRRATRGAKAEASGKSRSSEKSMASAKSSTAPSRSDEPTGAERALHDAKNALRAHVRDAINGLKPLARERKVRAACEFALRSPPLAGRGLVLAYRAMRDEICVDAIAEALAARGWRIAFPAVDDAGSMRLFELATGPRLPALFDPARWSTDRHGVRAPRRDGAGVRSIWPRELDAVLVPGRAFDRAGNRLGRGKGYYDRLLARLRPDARAATVGVAFGVQIAETVPSSKDDRPVGWIASDLGITRARR